MRRLATAVAAIAALILPGAAASAQDVALAPVFPESSYFDPASKSWFVSNLGPSFAPDAQDGDGFISRLETGGRVTQRWVDGLDAPKGLRAFKGKLFVADIDELVVIDIAKAAISARVRLPGASIANDVDLDRAGNAYVTDWTGNRIYRVDRRGRATVLLASPKLEGPNGILVEGGELTIAAWGTNIQPSAPWGTDEPGRLLRVNIARRTIRPLGSGERIGGLDGLERDGSSYLATDWAGGRVLRIAPDGSHETLFQLPPSTADIGFDPATRTLGVPLILASAVVFEHL